MTNATWPLSRLTHDHVPLSNGGVRFGILSSWPGDGPLAWLQQRHAKVLICIASKPESDIAQKMKGAVRFLACGAMRDAGIVISVDDGNSLDLSDLILSQKGHDLWGGIAVDVDHSRSPLAAGGTELPTWLEGVIHSAANNLPAADAERTAVAAGLHLLYDDLDGSHALSQTIEGRGKNRNGDYWHAIMHRREPDYGNSQYWFRRVGLHPVFAELPAVLDRVRKEFSSALLDEWAHRLVNSDRWDPMAFVDACEAAANHPTETAFRQALEEIQHFEMLHLLVQTCADAGA